MVIFIVIKERRNTSLRMVAQDAVRRKDVIAAEPAAAATQEIEHVKETGNWSGKRSANGKRKRGHGSVNDGNGNVNVRKSANGSERESANGKGIAAQESWTVTGKDIVEGTAGGITAETEEKTEPWVAVAAGIAEIAAGNGLVEIEIEIVNVKRKSRSRRKIRGMRSELLLRLLRLRRKTRKKPLPSAAGGELNFLRSINKKRLNQILS